MSKRKLTILSKKASKKYCYTFNEKTLKGIPGVRPDNQKVFRALGPRIKHFKRLFYRLINRV